jgi:myo-inositol-1(or 4)-monophosphatase
MRLLITAGPTREPIDPVRFLSNRSSGRMGYALAAAACGAGHEVLLISGPVAIPAPAGVQIVQIETAREMFDAVQTHLINCDAAIFSAAVADYRPSQVVPQKLKKIAATLTLELERTEDILGSVRSKFGFQGFLVGFAAETENLIAHAQEKLLRKGCDLIIANDVSQAGIGFDSVENEVTLCLPGGQTIPLPRQSKTALARELIAHITRLSSPPSSAVKELLATAIEAAHAAGKMIKDNFGSDLTVNEMQRHDIKLELDVQSQKLITDMILARFPEHAILGEEGGETGGNGDVEWIVDPIDGTVNYFFSIPHFCVSIAARKRESKELLIGVIFDPMQNETWTVIRGEKAQLNGKPIAVSNRAEMAEAVVTVGFSKSKEALDLGFERYKRIAYEVRKTRMLGSAALAMAYIATGRLDAYVEEQISLWDIAAGQLMVEMGGGKVTLKPSTTKPGTMFICATNGKLPIEEYL